MEVNRANRQRCPTDVSVSYWTFLFQHNATRADNTITRPKIVPNAFRISGLRPRIFWIGEGGGPDDTRTSCANQERFEEEVIEVRNSEICRVGSSEECSHYETVHPSRGLPSTRSTPSR
ncbi:hypothetical protein EAI_11310 [Harpegnathos saltator]|uniref:Uncharacterized protein n=1 Tax=Harpegnathos saltator TaxID=610380 RepID=E2BDQ9_HARSA|nr:hypothetical protein EAI_11310 [Harpegnathos saltator]